MSPLYSYIGKLYPGPENVERRWKIAQRIEHFVISSIVDIIVLTLLLRLVDKQQHKLRESEERYRTLFEHADEGIAIIGATDYQLIDANKKFGDILGRQAQALVGHDIRRLLRNREDQDPPGPLLEIIQACEQGSKRQFTHEWSDEREITYLSAGGKELLLLVSCSALSAGGERLLILITRDLTERRGLEREKEEIQRQLFQTSKLASIGELSAGVAHEINNPLNVMVNFAELLKGDGIARNPNEEEMIEGIISEGERIAEIVRNLLTFARRDSHLPTLVSIPEVIASSLALFGHQLDKDGIEVELDIDDNLPSVVAEAARLRQVVVNMISNGRHALESKPAGPRHLRIVARSLKRTPSRLVRIEFFDNGVGIPQENIERIFDPFFTTRRENGGTGLGLSLSFGIIQSYGGKIYVESAEGSYTRFIIELPAARSRKEEYVESPTS